MRELSSEPLKNDAFTVWVGATVWACPLCEPDGGEGSSTTVDWIGSGDGPDGRCSTCGAKLCLAKMGESVPSVEEQLKGRI